MTAFVRRFAEESAERLRRMESLLARLEASPGDGEATREVMREAHTVKGGARMLRQIPIQDLAHAFEDSLTEVIQGRRGVTPVVMDGFFAALAALRDRVARLLPGGPPGEPPDATALVQAVRDGTPPPGAPPAPSAPPATGGATGRATPSSSTGLSPGSSTSDSTAPSGGSRRRGTGSVRVSASRLNALANLTVEMAVERARVRAGLGRLDRLHWNLSRVRAAGGGPRMPEGLKAAMAELDREHRRLVDEGEDAVARRAALDAELMDHVQALRMTPLSVVLDAFPASVREIARGFGKEVDLRVAGAETELDRRIVDEVGEPLVHLLRNALDHGIEPPADREAAGKPRRGSIAITASASEGAILVVVEDDGRGIEPARVRAAAVRKGILSQDEAARIPDDRALDLVFVPGFSTKEQVGEISGRGVGMDTVRAALGRLGGSVSVTSVPGRGTRITCRLPLTLALLRVVLFRCGGEQLAIPLSACRWAGTFARWGQEGYGPPEVAGEPPLPVAGMAEILGLADPASGADTPPPHALLVEGPGGACLLTVDEVLEETEVALREAPEYLRANRLVAGVTLLGTGDPAVVVEPSELLGRALARRAPPAA